jgi:hypothetical protein
MALVRIALKRPYTFVVMSLLIAVLKKGIPWAPSA